MRAPYIIIGMHRSGTSMLAKILEKAGIFMGVIKDHNYEAIHFLSLNQQSMYAAGSDWLEPKVPEKEYWKRIPAEELYREHFRLNNFQQKLVIRLKNPEWGWKDPRNTFTLPMWLDMFPDAKVIHLYRKQEDVALSLQKRNSAKGEVFDERLHDIDFNRELHQKYIDQARSYKPLLKDRFLEIKYEDLIHRKKETVQALENFTGTKLKDLLKKYVR